MYSVPSYYIPWLAPPIVFNTLNWWSWWGDLVTLLNKMVFISCTTSASFTLGWVFIALTPTHDTPSLHVILDVAEVQWNDITTPGSQSQASRPAGLPPSRWDQSTQPKELKSQNTWVTPSDVHMSLYVSLTTCDWCGAYRGSNTVRESARPIKTRRDREEGREIYL